MVDELPVPDGETVARCACCGTQQTPGTQSRSAAPKEDDPETAALLERAFLFLEDGDWANADAYCERVLDRQPKNALAYLGKMLISLGTRRLEELAWLDEPFDQNPNYEKLCRFGNAALLDKLQEMGQQIRLRRYEPVYRQGVLCMNAAETEKQFLAAAACFDAVPSYKDADLLADDCRERADTLRKNSKLQRAKFLLGGAKAERWEGIALLREIPGWKDADGCLRKALDKERTRRRILLGIAAAIGVLVYMGLRWWIPTVGRFTLALLALIPSVLFYVVVDR